MTFDDYYKILGISNKNFVISGKIMGMVLGVVGVNMLIGGIKTASGI
jgi:small neutral amino acid transporter SnatA (MarC family)